jgi:hypothetical protein
MKLCNALAASAALFAVAAGSPASAAAPLPIDQAAKLFATRSSAFSPDLSPYGDKLLYLGAGPGAVTYLHVLDIASGKDSVVIESSGQPEQLSYCSFADETWAICNFHGDMSFAGTIYGVSRVAAVDTSSGKVIRLGAADQSAEHPFVQFDGAVIDWLPEKTGAILNGLIRTPETAAGSATASTRSTSIPSGSRKSSILSDAASST